MKAIGSSVRINSTCSANGRTGRIVKASPEWDFWTELGWHRVEMDPPGLVSWGLFPPSELDVIAASARHVTQGDLFGGAA